MTYKPNKLGQVDLVFNLPPEFISRSVHARLHVSTCHPGYHTDAHTDRQLLTGYTISSANICNWRNHGRSVVHRHRVCISNICRIL